MALSLVLAFCAVHPSKALTEERFWTDSATGLAIGGFDPVSFFTEAVPEHGLPDYEWVWQGAAWRFSSEGNLAAFKRDPEIYAPQFGGLGAVSLARGYHAAGNPRVWLVSRGKLYLFFSAQNRSEWIEVAETLNEQAVAEWERITR